MLLLEPAQVMKPESHELLAILILQLSPEPPANIELPRDEQQLAKGLLAAVEKAPSIGLETFVNMETSQLTEAAQVSLKKTTSRRQT